MKKQKHLFVEDDIIANNDIKELKIKTYMTPRNYTIVMSLVFLFQLIFSIINPSYFGFAGTGFIFGLWLGFILRWIFIK